MTLYFPQSMKFFFFLFCFLGLHFLAANAQQTLPHVANITIFYDQNWDVTVKQEATYFRVATLDTVQNKFVGVVTDYYGLSVPYRQVTYSEKGKDGSFQVFYANKRLESQGYFLQDQPAGIWKFFYPDGKPKQTVQFLNGEDFKIIEFYDTAGQQLVKEGTGSWSTQKMTNVGLVSLPLHVEGQWKDSLKVGKWTAIQADGRKVYEELFKAGVFQHGQVFDNTGQKVAKAYTNAEIKKRPLPNSLERAEQLSISPVFGSQERAMHYILRKEHLLPVDTSRYAYKSVETKPEYFGGQVAMFKYLSQNFRTPSDAAKAGVQGTSVISVLVGADGTPTNVKVVKSLFPSVDAEVVRVVKSMKKWKPGTVNGVPAPVTYTVPFRLVITREKAMMWENSLK